MILRTIHVGITGRGQWAIDDLGKDPRYNPVAIVEANTTAAKVAQYRLKELGRANVPFFSGLTGALSQVEADALVIGSPARTHAEYIRMAFTVNMHVLVNPPIVCGYNEGRQLFAESEVAWAKFCVAQADRYSAPQKTIAGILADASHPQHPGKGMTIDIFLHRHLPNDPDIDYPNSILWETAMPYADSLLAWVGRAKRASARIYAMPWTEHISAGNLLGEIEFDNGTICRMHLSNDFMVARDQVIFQGERGALVMRDHRDVSFYPRPAAPALASEPEAVALLQVPQPGQAIADEFFKYVVEDVEPGISARRNLRAVALCEMMARSASLGRPVERTELTAGESGNGK